MPICPMPVTSEVKWRAVPLPSDTGSSRGSNKATATVRSVVNGVAGWLDGDKLHGVASRSIVVLRKTLLEAMRGGSAVQRCADR